MHNNRQDISHRWLESVTNIILISLLLMATVSYTGKLWGYKIEHLLEQKKEVEIVTPNSEQLNTLGITNTELFEQRKGHWSNTKDSDAKIVLNTLAFSESVYGFGGPIPMFLYLENQNIKNILILENDETEAFLSSAVDEGLIRQWIGKSIAETKTFTPDAISGATVSSNAINRSIQNSLAILSHQEIKSPWLAFINIKNIAAVLVILFAVFLTFKSTKNKHLRTVQLLLNTIILGFWCGQFISIKVLLTWSSQGLNLISGGIIFLMLILGILIPLLFNKKRFYCHWLCPLGSAQELTGKISKKKVHLKHSHIRLLKQLQSFITLALFFSLWLGVTSDIVDYEPFSAFLFQHASWAVISIALLGIITSIFIHRPWCRFACPTGQVLSWIHKMK